MAGGGVIAPWFDWTGTGDQLAAATLTATAIGCALLARSGVRWDAEPLSYTRPAR